MQHIFALAMAAVLFLPGLALAGDAETCRIVYSETVGEKTATKEYLIQENGLGYEILLALGDVRRLIVTSQNMATIKERYWNTASPDRVDVERRGSDLVFKGSIGDKQINETKSLDDEVWFGSVLLLKDFVLSEENEQYFYVTKPEETKAVLLKAIREGVETVTVGGQPVEAVKVKFTVPDFRGLFWSSYYWYRADDGLLVKTLETRGGPGTPKARVELADDASCRECPWLDPECPEPGSIAVR